MCKKEKKKLVWFFKDNKKNLMYLIKQENLHKHIKNVH